MAATPAGARLSEAHRQIQVRLSVRMMGQLTRLWPLLDPYDLDGSAGRWITGATAAVRQGQTASRVVSLRYLDQFRRAEIGSGIDFTIPAVDLDPRALATSLLTQGPVKAKVLVAAGQTLADAMATASVTSAAAGTRHVLNGGRSTIVAAADADPAARGFRRVTSAGCCAFCAMLAARDYHGLTSGFFKAHDNCHCQPETAYHEDRGSVPRQGREFAALYDEATAGVGGGGTNKLNAFRRALAAQRKA